MLRNTLKKIDKFLKDKKSSAELILIGGPYLKKRWSIFLH